MGTSAPVDERLISSELKSVQALLRPLTAAAANGAACLEVVVAWKPRLSREDLPPTPHPSHLWFDELQTNLQQFPSPEFYLSLFRLAAATGLRNSVLVRLPTVGLFPHVREQVLVRALDGVGPQRAPDVLRTFLQKPLDQRLAGDCPLLTGCVIGDSPAQLCARLTPTEFLATFSNSRGTFDASALRRGLSLHGRLLVCTEGAHYWHVPPQAASPRFVPFEVLYQLYRQRGLDLRSVFRAGQDWPLEQHEPPQPAYGLPWRARCWFAKAWLDARDRQVALGFLSISDPATGSLGAPPTSAVLRQLLLELRFFGNTHGWLRDDFLLEALPEYQRARGGVAGLARLLRPLANEELQQRASALPAAWAPLLLDDCLRRATKYVLGFVLADRAQIIECELSKYEARRRTG